MRHPFNYLSLLAPPRPGRPDLFAHRGRGFPRLSGFLVFLRYLWVNPDELFLLTLRRAATSAFLAECVLLAPLLLLLPPGPRLQSHAPGPGLSAGPLPDLLLPVPHLAGVEGGPRAYEPDHKVWESTQLGQAEPGGAGLRRWGPWETIEI
ncbi:MAG: hypothetical protein ACLR0P_06050 [Oscillospiraceae bacterium]